MTLRYSHLAPSHKQRAVDILGKKMDTFWTLEPKFEIVDNPKVSQHVDIQSVI